MKRYLLILSLCVANITYAQKEILQQYIDDADYFKLRKALQHSKLPTEKRIYFEAFVANAFNQNELSVLKADSLIKSKTVNDSEKTEVLLELQVDNYTKLYEYKKASDCGNTALKYYTKYIQDTADLNNTLIVLNALSGISKQAVERSHDVLVSIHKDQSNLWNLPIHTEDTTIDFIFDSGANISTIPESTAKKMKIKRLNVSFDVGSLLGNKVKSSLGIADIEIGDIKIKNVVFLIMPDESLSFPQANYYIHGIIGFPVMHALKELHILKTGSLMIPLHPTSSNFQNLALNGLTPILQAATDEDTLSFSFDTGAMETMLYSNYYEQYVKNGNRKAKKKTVKMGGAGSVEKIKSLQLKDFSFYIGDKVVVMDKITVSKEKINNNKKAIYGNIGQDVIRQFDEMVINFDSMYIAFK